VLKKMIDREMGREDHEIRIGKIEISNTEE
jgi:hypothetical protein